MTDIQLRTDAAQPDDGAAILLDWFESKAASTVRYKTDFLKGLTPSPVALDLLRLGAAVYCTDKVVKRAAAPDGWTRELSLHLPVSDVALWDGAKGELVEALSFLSGDHWDLSFVADTVEPAGEQPLVSDFDGVSLFSGGLDSLSGAIDRLEAGERLILVGHHDSGLTANKQKQLFDALAANYGSDRLALRKLFLRPGSARKGQARPLPPGGVENTTRSRSFLFFAAGIAVADALGASAPLYVPENGFIGINVPLTPARSGSFSTRTTHPLYMHKMRHAFDLLGLQHPLENPYRLLTKGELLEQNSNRKLLLALAPDSISCSHPEALRWVGLPQGNCGYCYPCLIRRASMHHVGEDRFKGHYGWDALHDASLLGRECKRGRSLRALTASLGRPERTEDVVENGRIPNGETRAFFDVYRRGRAELRDWLKGAGPALRRRLA
jgi:7-cyano-7-deazaguanine synthase in queuosine biosynthesis